MSVSPPASRHITKPDPLHHRVFSWAGVSSSPQGVQQPADGVRVPRVPAPHQLDADGRRLRAAPRMDARVLLLRFAGPTGAQQVRRQGGS